MTRTRLYFAPDTCARVVLIALEEIGEPYELETVAFMKGDHRSKEFLALNPKGKVPTLVVDGRPLSETLAILSWLSESFPDAHILPRTQDSFENARQLADLSYCASGLHPIVKRLRIPQHFCDTPEGIRRVYELAEMALRPNLALIEQRFTQGQWWYGEYWSIIDAYINWVWARVVGAGINASDFPNILRHDEAIKQRPAVARALAKNQEISEELASQGLEEKFSGTGAITGYYGAPQDQKAIAK